MHTNTHAHPRHRPTRQRPLLWLTIYAQICIHIHIHMYIHAYVHIYIYTCIYMHIHMSAHIHTYTYIYTHIQHVHMHAREHTWDDGVAAIAREARLDTKKLRTSPLFNAINHILHLRLQDFIVSTSWNLNTTQPHHPLPNIPQNSSRTAQAQFSCPNTACHSRVHHFREAPCSFTMAPCVVVESKGNGATEPQ